MAMERFPFFFVGPCLSSMDWFNGKPTANPSCFMVKKSEFPQILPPTHGKTPLPRGVAYRSQVRRSSLKFVEVRQDFDPLIKALHDILVGQARRAGGHRNHGLAKNCSGLMSLFWGLVSHHQTKFVGDERSPFLGDV